ncbi:MAG: GAF domain-containing protein [Nitrospirae bacterium]|nr:GAF domain-containing protein [Candidatus Manganitrophaceae bacterium]
MKKSAINKPPPSDLLYNIPPLRTAHSEKEILENTVGLARALWGMETGLLVIVRPGAAPQRVAFDFGAKLKKTARRLLAQTALLDRLRRRKQQFFWADPATPALLIPIPLQKPLPFSFICLLPSPRSRMPDPLNTAPLAASVATALESLWSARESERALLRLDHLFRIVAEISAERELPVLLRKIVQGGMTLLGLDAGGLSLWDAARQEFVVRTAMNMPTGFEGSVFRMGEGIGGMAARMGKTIALNPERASAARRIKWGSYPVMVGVPLRREERLIGAVNFQSKFPDRNISDRDCLLLEAFARHAAIAIENVQSLDAVRRDLAEADALRRVGMELGAETDRARLSATLLQHGLALSRLEAGWIALWDAATGSLRVEGEVDLPAGWIGKKIKPGEGILGRAVQQRKVLWVGRRREGDPLPADLRPCAFEAAIAVPLIWQEKVLGGFCLGSRALNRQISARERKILEGFSEHAAAALANAERHGSLQREQTEGRKALEARTEELHHLREENSRKEKLAALGQIVGSVNHELRQPLEVITNAVYYLQLQMEREETGPIRQEFGRFLSIINDECRSATDLVNELLDFTRKKQAVSIRVDLNQLLEELLGRIQVPEKVRIKTDFSRRRPLVFIDPVQVSRALTNFVVNGIQAMTQGGILRVVTRVSRQSAQVAVRDTGEGIAPENMERLFQPLFTTKARGVGLGLPLAKQYIEANQGRIEVESELGVGTAFRVSFPLVQS